MNLKLKAKIVENYGTQIDFSEALEIDPTIVSKIIRGRRKLPVETQQLWANKLNCKPEEIFTVETMVKN